MSRERLERRPRRLSTIWVSDGHPCFFLTICVAERRPVLANDVIHARVVAFLETSGELYGWFPGRYVIMPDHIHLFVRQGDYRTTLGEWTKALKAMVSRREFKWQRGFFDRVLRSSESAEEKWEYVYQNPVRAGLAKRAEDWRFGGEVDSGG